MYVWQLYIPSLATTGSWTIVDILSFGYCKSAFTGGSSQPSGPNRGMHIITPFSFLTGFDKVHKADPPREDSQEGFTTVRPKILTEHPDPRRNYKPTFQPDSRRSDDFMINYIFRRRITGQSRRRMDKHIFCNAHGPVGDPFAVSPLCPGRYCVHFIFSHCYLVYESGCQKLSQNFDLRTTLNTKHNELFSSDLKVAGWLYLGYETSVNTWEIELDNVADLGTEFIDFFHDLGDNCHFTSRNGTNSLLSVEQNVLRRTCNRHRRTDMHRQLIKASKYRSCLSLTTHEATIFLNKRVNVIEDQALHSATGKKPFAVPGVPLLPVLLHL